MTKLEFLIYIQRFYLFLFVIIIVNRELHDICLFSGDHRCILQSIEGCIGIKLLTADLNQEQH